MTCFLQGQVRHTRRRALLRQKDRKGAIAVLSALLLIGLLGITALAIDFGYVMLVRTQLQNSADASALAGAGELLQQQIDGRYAESRVRNVAAEYAALNQVGRQNPSIDLNGHNDRDGDLLIGRHTSQAEPMQLGVANTALLNAVRARVRRSSDINGNVSLFFARAFGIEGVEVAAQAQAAFENNFRGFRVPQPHSDPPENLMLLPFSLPITAWQAAVAGSGADEFGWDNATNSVTTHSDGTPEINLYPLHTGSAGNWGTVDIGSNNSSTPTLRRQISNGVTESDLAFHGGMLSLDRNGTLNLSADPGVKASIGPSLQTVLGQPRIITLYESIQGDGQDATYKIVGFAGVRIVSVDLTSEPKHVIVQKAAIITRGGIPGGDGPQLSQSVYSPVRLTE